MIAIAPGDCLTVMREAFEDDTFDAIVTDPPYGLEFMGKGWDHGVPGAAFWTEALRIAKPGAHLVAFGGTRTYHRLACAIEDAGWEVRDCLSWLYGSGFPKSLSVSKAIETLTVYGGSSQKQLRQRDMGDNYTPHPLAGKSGFGDGNLRKGADGDTLGRQRPVESDAARAWQGWGTALKPAWEPAILARKPLVGTVAANVLAHGTGAINVDACRIETDGPSPSVERRKHAAPGVSIGSTGWITPARPASYNEQRSGEALGRWPANVALDEEAAAMLGEPSRFFYTAKASRRERGEGNTHPTVKPLALMRWLVKLVTPPGGVILDPFAGSGTTLLAAQAEGFDAIGIEREAEYVAIIKKRLGDAGVRCVEVGL